ncbi:MAG: AAA family ATPase [Bacteroidales bacterium]|nr:AAA family ATPase [Bacteroidales bacterium]
MANVVKRIVIEGLYDNHNYDIPFQNGGITLITGPNGFGKTTILNIINNALEQRFAYFYELLFDKIILFFGDFEKEQKLVIKKSKVLQETLFDEDIEYKLDIEFYIDDINKPIDTLTIDRGDIIQSRNYASRFSEDDLDLFLENDENYARKSFLNINHQRVKRQLKNFQIFLNDKKCLFIREQRIFSANRLNDNNEKYTITQIADDLKNRYAQQKSLYTDESQKIDSSFVERLLGKNYKAYDENEYYNRVNELKRYVEEYQKFNLISKYSFLGKFDSEFKPALSLYIEDMFNKIKVYEDFYRQLSLFNRFVNGKGLSNKTMILNEKNGISFKSDSGRVVPLQRLSSGEQNLVILYYRLVFETEPNTLLLIDEPENSMHVEWLEKMLSDYFVMENILKCQMIIATHSPIFIGDNFNVAYDLYGGAYQDWMK